MSLVNSMLRMLGAWVLFQSVACSPVEWAHTVSKSSILWPDGGVDEVRWKTVCKALGKGDSCDVCAELGWYGDDACDAFCPSRDARCPPEDPTLVGHWRFDETSGRTAVDDSPFQNHGTYAGSPAPTAGRFGSALEFHGPGTPQASSDRILVGDPTNGSLDFGTSSFSYGIWVNVTRPGGPYDLPLTKGGQGSDAPGYDFELGTGSWIACVADGDAGACGTLSPTPQLGRWVHLMGVVDREAKTFQLYLDGHPVATVRIPATFGSVSSSNEASFGAATNGRHAFRGLIDDVRLYSRALGPIEVFELQQ